MVPRRKLEWKIKDPVGCVIWNRECGSGLGRESSASRWSTMDGPGVSRDSLELEDKKMVSARDWRNPSVLSLGREKHCFRG